jgi:serine/threonine-protein kinase
MAALAADRNLLFGLLALQNGLIDQGQLVAAFQAWTRDKARTLAEHLEARGDLSAVKRALLDALAEVHLEAHDGDVEESLAVVPANRSTRAGLADLGEPEIEATLARVARNNKGQATEADDDDDRTSTLSVGAATSDGQRFRLLRPHARGGLGEVFVALDAELHREVALKQILEKHADDPTSRARFLLEAEVTGGLEHPGIVPVYGLGTYDGGRPYYAMRFIRGDSLKEAIDCFHMDEALRSDPGHRSLELRKLLRRFTDVCNAIEYAHSRGVLHRDIKPGNIIVGKHGETLMVDWGLAKATGRTDPGVDSGERALVPSSASGSADTLPGSALGTPAYMSPEQAEGDIEHLGPRSDVYSLGATLYYLLTGRPPLEGEIGDVLRAVQRGDVTPPRRHNATIDAALEAVCLKAMGREPATRYASPKELSDDLERWMADEPVSSRPDRGFEKLARWSRKHRPLTWSAAAALAVLAVSSTVAALVVNLARGHEAAARIQADVNAERATANFNLARQAVDDYLTRVSENTLLKAQPSRDLRDLRKALLEDALKFYRAFINQRGDDRALRRDLAGAYARVATITDEIGTKTAALTAHAKALEIRRALSRDNPGDSSLRVDLADSLRSIAVLQRSLGRIPECLGSHGEARGILEAIVAIEPNRPDALSALGQICSHSGSVHKSSEEWVQAQSLFSRARDIFARLVEIEPGEPKHIRSLAWSTYQMGNVLSIDRRKDRDLPGAKACYDTALALQRDLIAAHPGEPSYPIDMAQCYVSLAYMVSRGVDSDHQHAIRYLEEALDLQKRVVAAHPSVTEYLMDLSATCFTLGYQCSQLSRHDDALRWYREAVGAAERLVALDSENIDFQERLALAVNNYGYKLLMKGHTDDALGHFLRAIDVWRGVLAKAPQIQGYRGAMLHPLINAAKARNLQGRPSDAVNAALEARSLCYGFPDALGDIASQLAKAGGIVAVGTPERNRYLKLAMEALRAALASGATKPGEVVADENFAPLRERREFQALAFDPVFPSDPFAHPK